MFSAFLCLLLLVVAPQKSEAFFIQSQRVISRSFNNNNGNNKTNKETNRNEFR